MSLNGYTTPLTSTGLASLVPPPPWHFSGTVIMVEYAVDPDAARQHLPSGMTLDPARPHAAAIFGDWQSTSADLGDLSHPGRTQYQEFYIAIAALYEGRPVVRAPFCWVDKDFSLVRGLIQGYPKKLGDIGMSRSYGVGKAALPLQSGTTLTGHLSADGQRMARVQVDLERAENASDAPFMMTGPLVHSRVFPTWSADGHSVDELVTGGSQDQEVAGLWSGTGAVELYDDPWHGLPALRPLEIVRGYRMEFAETIAGGQLLDGRSGR